MRLAWPSAMRIGKSGPPRWLLASVVLCLAILGLSGSVWHDQPVHAAEGPQPRPSESDEPIEPIVPPKDLDQRKVELGGKLFHDPRLSHNNRLSCSSCHILRAGGSDGRARSTGIGGAVGEINAPTVLNSGFNFSQFWDGRADTLEAQVEEPLQSKSEMGSTWQETVRKLKTSPEYVQAFRRIYGGVIQRDTIKNSIAEFERSLSTPNSRFDKYLRHESPSITGRELQGYLLFKSLGCASCHQGMNVGGNMYQKVGVMAPYFADRGNIGRADFGRFNVTGNESDRYMFKVPSLRNVVLTPPYFHDGSATTLLAAVDMMAKYQLGRVLRDSEAELIVEFLKTLSGELNGRPL